MKTKKSTPTLYLLIVLCFWILGFYVGFRCSRLARKFPEPFKQKVPTIKQVQTMLVNKGYDIGPHGIDGKLADCDTFRAWRKCEFDQLRNLYAARYMTPSGAPEGE